MNHMKKWRKAVFILLLILCVGTQSLTASAYYNRGIVEIAALGSSSVSVETGKSVSVTVAVSPESYTGNVGCGMAECPQICGGMCGDEVTGQCQCAGDEKKTAYTDMSVTVGNASVATASYQNGVLTIKGQSVGSTTITLVATLWQYTNSSAKTISVSVTAPTVTSQPGGSQTSQSGSASSQPVVSTITPNKPSSVSSGSGTVTSVAGGGTVSVAEDGTIVIISGGDAAEVSDTGETNTGGTNDSAAASGETESETQSPGDSGTVTMETQMGTVQMVTIQNDDPTGGVELQQAKDNGGRVTFQKKDSGGNVLYSWTFLGEHITDPADISLGITFEDSAPAGFSEAEKLQKPFYFSFTHEGNLPGEADIYINVGSTYEDGDVLALYYFNEEKGEMQLVRKNLSLDAGYVSFSLEHCSSYVIALYETNSTPIGLIIGIVVAAALILGGLAAALLLARSKKRLLRASAMREE